SLFRLTDDDDVDATTVPTTTEGLQGVNAKVGVAILMVNPTREDGGVQDYRFQKLLIRRGQR
ncbi:hypothetical protein U1Q18_024378, partial [Sarracenia purpurea var. burkii]